MFMTIYFKLMLFLILLLILLLSHYTPVHYTHNKNINTTFSQGFFKEKWSNNNKPTSQLGLEIKNQEKKQFLY